MPGTLEELTKRAAALEQRANTLEFSKSDKAEVVDVAKRTDALENKFGIAVTVAAILGLGGAGIGVLIYNAYNKIDDLRQQAAALEQRLIAIDNTLEQKLGAIDKRVAEAKEQATNDMRASALTVITEFHNTIGAAQDKATNDVRASGLPVIAEIKKTISAAQDKATNDVNASGLTVISKINAESAAIDDLRTALRNPRLYDSVCNIEALMEPGACAATCKEADEQLIGGTCAVIELPTKVRSERIHLREVGFYSTNKWNCEWGDLDLTPTRVKAQALCVKIGPEKPRTPQLLVVPRRLGESPPDEVPRRLDESPPDEVPRRLGKSPLDEVPVFERRP